MSVVTPECDSVGAVDVVDAAPYRLRKPAPFFPAPSMLDLQQLVEQSGQRELILRIAHAARQLEAKGQRCHSLAELDAHSQLTRVPLEEAAQSKTSRLQRLIEEASALAVELGAELEAPEVRAVCFGFAGCCQRTAAEIRRQQLWSRSR